MRLLLVEDEKRMAQALCAILQQEKYDVDHFADGWEGLLALESKTYDLAVLVSDCSGSQEKGSANPHTDADS